MNAIVVLVSGALASGIGVVLIQGIKSLYLLIFKKDLDGNPALWTTVIVSTLLSVSAIGVSGGFTPPWPTIWTDWVVRIGEIASLFFTAMTIIYKQVAVPVIAKFSKPTV